MRRKLIDLKTQRTALLEGAEALWVGTDGTVKASPGFPDNLLD